MNKIRYLQSLKTFGFCFFNKKIEINSKFRKEDINNCRLCNLYKNKKYFYVTKVIKSKFFILSSFNLNAKEELYLDNILKETLNLNLKNIYFSSIVKCSNEYTNEHFSKCINYFINEFIESEAEILLLLGENLKEIFALKNNFVGEKIFHNFNNKIIKILINYDLQYIKKNPSYEKKFINNFKKIKE